MLKIKVLAVGKCKELWLNEALSDYEKRLSPSLRLEWVFPRSDKELAAALEQEASFIALDPKGTALDSPSFSRKLMKLFEEQGSRLVLVIGGPEGIPKELLKKALFSWSLSPLTFTHQIVRLILVEQLYRALEIAKGSPYHK